MFSKGNRTISLGYANISLVDGEIIDKFKKYRKSYERLTE